MSDDSGQDSASSYEKVRFGFVQTILGTINENDAKAAIRVWATNLVKEMNIQARPVINVYKDIPQIRTQLEKEPLDILCLTTLQWFAVRHLIAEDSLLAVKAGGSSKDDYVVMVHQNTPAKAIVASRYR